MYKRRRELRMPDLLRLSLSELFKLKLGAMGPSDPIESIENPKENIGFLKKLYNEAQGNP